MRIVVAILSASIILGLTWLYQQTLAVAELPEMPSPASEVRSTYRLKIAATFDAGVDPFAEDVSDASSLRVSLLGESIFAIDEPITAGKSIEKELDLQLRTGTNEFLIEMTPASTAEIVPRAIHIELYHGSGQEPIESHTIWADGTSSKLVGRVPFEVDADSSSFQEDE